MVGMIRIGDWKGRWVAARTLILEREHGETAVIWRSFRTWCVRRERAGKATVEEFGAVEEAIESLVPGPDRDVTVRVTVEDDGPNLTGSRTCRTEP